MIRCACYVNRKTHNLLGLVGNAQLFLVAFMVGWLLIVSWGWVSTHSSLGLGFVAKFGLLVVLQILIAILVDIARAAHIAQCEIGWPFVVDVIDLKARQARSILSRVFEPLTFVSMAKASGTLPMATLPPPKR